MQLSKAQIREWVAALRSGDYAQGTGALCRSRQVDGEPDVQEFCCLGVACDLFLDTDWEDNDFGRWILTDSKDHSMPPQELQDAINDALPGLNKGSANGSSACGALASRNDGGDSFKMIAFYIDRAAGL